MSITRRQLLKIIGASSAAIVVSSGLQGCVIGSANARFDHGVASGDPLTDRVIIWTRATPVLTTTSEVTVNWEVATDKAFKNLVNQASQTVTAATDFTLKVDVIGLQPGTKYYYRFKCNQTVSVVGETKTLPSDAATEVNFAVFSCSNYPAGFFHAYAAAATNADHLDAVLHLGDYIYEYDKAGYPDAGSGEAIDRVHSPVNECINLADYRQRYAQYRTDIDLQALHMAAPFICVWDDHEISNDTYKEGAENHQEDEGSFDERRTAAIQAWYEWLPVRAPEVEADRIKTYRRFDFGRIASLLMLDTRVLGRDKQLDYADYITVSGFDAAGFATDMADPTRSMLGAEQLGWLQGQLLASKSSGIAWQVLGQQVLMGRMSLPASIIVPDPNTGSPNPQNLINYQTVAVAYQALATAIVTDLTIKGDLANYAALIPGFTEMDATTQAIALTQAMEVHDPLRYGQIFASLEASQQTALINYGDLLDPQQNPSIPYNLDAWDGYAVEREVVLGTAKAVNSNLLVLAGDTHNAWASHLKDQFGDAVGVEFATTSVSSPGLEKYLQIPKGYETSTEAGIVQLITDLQYFNVSQRGYMHVKLTATEAQADWFLMPREAEKEVSRPIITEEKSLKVVAGSAQLVS